jgi:glycosyltransferase involved in cell wall biosynthesis
MATAQVLTATEGGARTREFPERPLKICVATWAPFLSGAEIGAQRVASGLQQAGHEVFVVLGERGPVWDTMQQAGLRCVHRPMPLTDWRHAWSYWRARRAMTRLLRDERPDLVHSNDLPTHQMMSAAAGPLGIPRVTYHKFPFGGQATDWMNKFGGEHHLFVSQALLDQMRTGSATLRDSPCSVIHDGLPLPEPVTAAERRAARQTLGLPADKVVIVFAGQIIERKGVAELVQAWSLLPGEVRQAAQLYLLGEAPRDQQTYRDEVIGSAAQADGGIHFPGFQRDMAVWLKAADAFTLPSHVDPLPLAIMEAMAYGLPVVSCAVTGIPEMVEHEKTGLLVSPRDPQPLAAAMERMIRDEEFRRECGHRGRRRCEQRFDIRQHVRRLEELYRIVLAQQSPTPDTDGRLNR